jgi:hypothetical protein
MAYGCSNRFKERRVAGLTTTSGSVSGSSLLAGFELLPDSVSPGAAKRAVAVTMTAANANILKGRLERIDSILINILLLNLITIIPVYKHMN